MKKLFLLISFICCAGIVSAQYIASPTELINSRSLATGKAYTFKASVSDAGTYTYLFVMLPIVQQQNIPYYTYISNGQSYGFDYQTYINSGTQVEYQMRLYKIPEGAGFDWNNNGSWILLQSIDFTMYKGSNTGPIDPGGNNGGGNGSGGGIIDPPGEVPID